MNRPQGPPARLRPGWPRPFPWLPTLLTLWAIVFPGTPVLAQVPLSAQELDAAVLAVQGEIDSQEAVLRDYVWAFLALDSVGVAQQGRAPYTADLIVSDDFLRYAAARLLTYPHPFETRPLFPLYLDGPLAFGEGQHLVRTVGELQDFFNALSPMIPGVLAEIRRLDAERLQLEGRRRLLDPSAQPLTQGPGTGAMGWTQRVDALVAEGSRLLDLGDFQGAEMKFREVLDLEPGHPGAFLGRGIAHLFLGQPELAVADLENAVRLAPENGRAFYWRGRVREEYLARPDLAAADYQAGCVTLDEASCHALRALAMDRDSSGENAYAAGDRATALQLFTEATEIDPRYPAAWFNRGLILEQMEDHASAIRSFSNFILHQENAEAYARGGPIPLPEPDDRGVAEAYFRIGLSHMKLGDYRQAVSNFHTAVTRATVADPQNQRVYMFFTAEGYAGLGDMERANLIYRQVCEMGEEEACRRIRERTP